MYEKEGTRIIVTTRTRSVYVLERLCNVPLSEKFTNSTEYSVPDKSQVYDERRPNVVEDKFSGLKSQSDNSRQQQNYHSNEAR